MLLIFLLHTMQDRTEAEGQKGSPDKAAPTAVSPPRENTRQRLVDESDVATPYEMDGERVASGCDANKPQSTLSV